MYLFVKALVPLKPWQNIKGRRARSELEGEFSQRSSIAVALGPWPTLASRQTAAASRLGDTHVCVRSAQILKKAWLERKPGPRVCSVGN